MRESRTYGSVRGARDETRVPTATPAGSSSCDDLQGRRGGAARSPRMRSAGDAIESCEAK